ncbi:MAG: ABC transporter ATP-binding protein [Clostridia bacterium]|nr:ABC transporter ATP-binding protein [Clostridia bacterium]
MKRMKTLAGSIREYRKASILTPSFVALEVVLECIIPYLMARLIDRMTGESLSPILGTGVILILAAMCSLVCGVMSGRCAATAGCGFAKNLRKDLFHRIQTFSFSDIDRFSTASLVTRMTTDVSNVQNAFQMLIRIAVRTPMMLIFSIAMSVAISARMSVIFFAIVPVLGLGLFLISHTVLPIFKRIFVRYDALNNSVQENVAGIRVVKSFVREEFEQKKFENASEEVRKDFSHVERILALNNPMMMTCMYVAMLLVSFFGARMIVLSGGTDLTTGQLSSLISYGIQILSSMMMLSMVFVMITIASESAGRIVEVLEYESTLTSPLNALTRVPDGSIDFDNVSFRYSTGSGRDALTGINLHIRSGQTVGIIGSTGSSKTTLIQLISRLYDTTEGVVRVGGHNVREYDLDALRQQVAVVLQKNVLFSGTIRDNLRWGKEDATDEEIRKACRIAQADEFVRSFPEGYYTYIEQGGTNVSGGQKQRLCIARALLRHPKILILDDSTSAVDTRTDALIQRGFAEEIPDTTKIIIAQRVSSVEHADVILVMEGGRIAEQGTHEELMAHQGISYEIYTIQTHGKEVA